MTTEIERCSLTGLSCEEVEPLERSGTTLYKRPETPPRIVAEMWREASQDRGFGEGVTFKNTLWLFEPQNIRCGKDPTPRSSTSGARKRTGDEKRHRKGSTARASRRMANPSDNCRLGIYLQRVRTAPTVLGECRRTILFGTRFHSSEQTFPATRGPPGYDGGRRLTRFQALSSPTITSLSYLSAKPRYLRRRDPLHAHLQP